jgi:translation elongation factor P/translation initiation factor 5A
MVQTKLRSLRSGTKPRIASAQRDKVDRVTLRQHEMESLYRSDNHYYFMNTEDLRSDPLDEETLGEGDAVPDAQPAAAGANSTTPPPWPWRLPRPST